MACECGGDCCQRVADADEYFERVMLPILKRANEVTESSKELIAKIEEDRRGYFHE